MTATTTMTIRIPVEVKERLTRIAEAGNRSQSYVAAKAIAEYVDHELPIIESILRGLEDIRAGRVIPHDQVMAEMRAIIAEARRKAPGTAASPR